MIGNASKPPLHGASEVLRIACSEHNGSVGVRKYWGLGYVRSTFYAGYLNILYHLWCLSAYVVVLARTVVPGPAHLAVLL